MNQMTILLLLPLLALSVRAIAGSSVRAVPIRTQRRRLR
jgi:hypothetical protein